MKVRPLDLREQHQFGKRLFLLGDSVPKPLGFSAFPADIIVHFGAGEGDGVRHGVAMTPPRVSATRASARVASLRCPILCPGISNIAPTSWPEP